jgi:hypothetical protein
VAIVNEVYLSTDGTADTVCIRTVTVVAMRIADKCCRNGVQNPTHREGLVPVDKTFVADLELIISGTHGA